MISVEAMRSASATPLQECHSSQCSPRCGAESLNVHAWSENADMCQHNTVDGKLGKWSRHVSECVETVGWGLGYRGSGV